jgi:hypothetical protein
MMGENTTKERNAGSQNGEVNLLYFVQVLEKQSSTLVMGGCNVGQNNAFAVRGN